MFLTYPLIPLSAYVFVNVLQSDLTLCPPLFRDKFQRLTCTGKLGLKSPAHLRLVLFEWRLFHHGRRYESFSLVTRFFSPKASIRCSRSQAQQLRGVRIRPCVLFDGPCTLISTANYNSHLRLFTGFDFEFEVRSWWVRIPSTPRLFGISQMV